MSAAPVSSVTYASRRPSGAHEGLDSDAGELVSVQRPTAPGSDDEEVAAGGERDPLSSGRPGRLDTARERSALDAVGSQEDDRPVSLDRKSPSVRGPGGRGFLEPVAVRRPRFVPSASAT